MNKAKLKALAARAGGLVPDALLVGGAGAVSFGAGMVYLPAGWIVGGLFLLAVGWIIAAGLLRGALKDQGEYFARALGSGGSPAWMTQDEVRALDELNPMGGEAAKLPPRADGAF